MLGGRDLAFDQFLYKEMLFYFLEWNMLSHVCQPTHIEVQNFSLILVIFRSSDHACL